MDERLCPNPNCGRPVTNPLATSCSRACAAMVRNLRRRAGEPRRRAGTVYSPEHMSALAHRSAAARQARMTANAKPSR